MVRHRTRYSPGEARIALEEEFNWHGFHLQKGHIFGTTTDGIRFVTALLPVKNDKGIFVGYKFYLSDPKWSHDINIWKLFILKESDKLVNLCFTKKEERDNLGLSHVKLNPKNKFATGYNPRLTSRFPMLPFKNMYVPNGGYTHVMYVTDPATGKMHESAAATW